jgi:large subunit ribosomal protein L25
MERISLAATKREIGKGSARRSRVTGFIPGILYGKGQSPSPLTVNEKELETAVRTHAGLNVLLNLSLDGKSVLARICDYQAHPIKRNFTHVDFQVVDLTKKINVEVPILFEGKAKGVKEGGVLVMDRRTLSVKCLPDAIPEHVIVDISALDIGDSIHIKDLKLPSGVECPTESNFGVVSVVAPMKEEVAAPVEGAVPAEGAVPGAAPVAGAPGAAPGAAPAAAPGAAPGAAPAAGAAKAPAAPAKEKK